MALLVGIVVVVGLLLFMVAELVFGPGLAVLLVGLCGLGLGGGAGFAAGIVGGLVGLVGSAILSGLYSGLAPDAPEPYSQQSPAVPSQPQWPAPSANVQPVPRYTPPPAYGPSASTLPTPLRSGVMPDPTSRQNAPTPLVAPGTVPAAQPGVRLPVVSGAQNAPPTYAALSRAALAHAAPSWRDSGQSARSPVRSPAPASCELPTRVALVRSAAPNRRPSATAPTPVEVRKTKGRDQ